MDYQTAIPADQIKQSLWTEAAALLHVVISFFLALGYLVGLALEQRDVFRQPPASLLERSGSKVKDRPVCIMLIGGQVVFSVGVQVEQCPP